MHNCCVVVWGTCVSAVVFVCCICVLSLNCAIFECRLCIRWCCVVVLMESMGEYVVHWSLLKDVGLWCGGWEHRHSMKACVVAMSW